MQFVDLLAHCKGNPAWAVVYLAYWRAVFLLLALAQMHATAKQKIWSSPFILPSEPSKLDKTRTVEKLLLVSIEINDENKYISNSKMAFSNVLEDIATNFFLWGKPPDSHFHAK